jgi:hypothetical protein
MNHQMESLTIQISFIAVIVREPENVKFEKR